MGKVHIKSGKDRYSVCQLAVRLLSVGEKIVKNIKPRQNYIDEALCLIDFRIKSVEPAN